MPHPAHRPTPDHRRDFEAIRAALGTPAGYIGAVGSVRKRAALFKMLSEEGFGDADLARVVIPVGLPIGAETPAEIAVSIVAQLIEARRATQRRGGPVEPHGEAVPVSAAADVR